ncbi:MAG TPA: triose-phosphate isomerase [Thermoanaerobaculia bacterium]
MPTRYVIANWKMNLPPEGVDAYVDALVRTNRNGIELVIAPPFPFLKDVARGAVPVAGQNCADKQSGAFTGEVAPSMLRSCGAEYVILGHSERRNIYGETDDLIARKLALAVETGLKPVLCIGEDLMVRDAGDVESFLANQIRAVVSDALEQASEIVIAYEPVWAIGTGRNASGAMVADTVAGIRAALGRFWPARYADGAAILYGGSVTPDNVADLVANGGIDGFLVGGASLDSGKFLAIRDGLDVGGESGKNSRP